MAMRDWNHDGKKDMIDNYIEYQMYKKMTEQKEKSSYTSNRGNGMSNFGAIISVIAGLILQALLYVALGIDVENVPVLVIVILWIVFSAITAVVVEKIGL